MTEAVVGQLGLTVSNIHLAVCEPSSDVNCVSGAVGRGPGGAARAGHRVVHDTRGVRARAHGRAHVGDRGADG